jgi:hypothetical protein
VQIKTVLRGGLAEQAGMMAGDEWLGLEAAGQAGACKSWTSGPVRRPRHHESRPWSRATGACCACRSACRPPGRRRTQLRLDVQDATVAQRWLSMANAA